MKISPTPVFSFQVGVNRTNFAIFGMIHQHMTFLMKCYFLRSGELWVNHIHIGLNWLSKHCFHCNNMSLRECFFSSNSHQNGGTKSKIVEHNKRLVLNHEFRSWPYSCKVNRRIENVCEIQLPFEIKCYEMHFCGENVAVLCCIFLEQHFVVIIMVIISYALKKE